MGVGPGSGVEVIGLTWGVYLICGLPLYNSLLKYGGLVQPTTSGNLEVFAVLQWVFSFLGLGESPKHL